MLFFYDRGGGYIFMKKIIEDLRAMQRIDYIPDSIGHKILDDVISLLTLLNDSEELCKKPVEAFRK
jgi:hypothetical protein